MLDRGHSVTGLPLKTAGGISLVALGALAGYAVGAGPAGEHPAAATAKRPVEVRTQTIRRTVRIVKRERPKHDRPDPAMSVASAAPAPAQQVEEPLLGLRGAALLTGARGRPPLAVERAAEAAAAISRVAAAHPELEALEVNPLLVTESKAIGLDARAIYSQPR